MENPSEFHEESRSVMICIITFQRGRVQPTPKLEPLWATGDRLYFMDVKNTGFVHSAFIQLLSKWTTLRVGVVVVKELKDVE